MALGSYVLNATTLERNLQTNFEIREFGGADVVSLLLRAKC